MHPGLAALFKMAAKSRCLSCADTGTIKLPPNLPPGVSGATHNWDKMSALVSRPEEISCPKCWRGEIRDLERKLNKPNT